MLWSVDDVMARDCDMLLVMVVLIVWPARLR